jgi:hypothetical protein
MAIKIETNAEWMTDECKAEIQAALDAINGLAREYTVCYANDVYTLSLRAEKHFEEHGVPVADRMEARVLYRPKVWHKNFYSKSSSISTFIHLRREEDGWYFVGAERAKAGPKGRERFDVKISDAAAIGVARRALGPFCRDYDPMFGLSPALAKAALQPMAPDDMFAEPLYEADPDEVA